MVKTEWRKVNYALLERLMSHRLFPWRWVRVDTPKGEETCLMDGYGRVWEFTFGTGLKIRPLWLQYESKAAKKGVGAAYKKARCKAAASGC